MVSDGQTTPASDTETMAATERWLIDRGLPHFIFRYSATRDVWTRAAPFLALVALAEVVVNAPSSDLPHWLSAVATVGAFLAVLSVWMLANHLRHRPLLARPTDVGPIEVALFVVVPALVPIVVDGQWRSGLVTGGANVALLAFIYLSTSYAIVPMVHWALGHAARQVLTVSALLVRALPFLLLIVIVVFMTSEPWQIADDLHWPVLLVASGLLFGTGVLFAVIRVPRQVGELSAAESWTALRDRVVSTPAAPLTAGLPDAPPDPPPLSRKEWGNVGLVVLASEGVLVATVALAMFGFLVLLGTLTIPPGVIHDWIGHAPDVLVDFTIFDERLVITTQLLKVAGFIAAFSGLQFTVSLLSDGQQQEEFLSGLRDELREALAVRAVYLSTAIRHAGAGPSPQ